MFSLIETIDSFGAREVSAVPSIWIIENGKKVMWPPTKQLKALTKKIKEQSPPLANWQSFQCKILMKDVGKNLNLKNCVFFFNHIKFFAFQKLMKKHERRKLDMKNLTIPPLNWKMLI